MNRSHKRRSKHKSQRAQENDGSYRDQEMDSTVMNIEGCPPRSHTVCDPDPWWAYPLMLDYSSRSLPMLAYSTRS